MINVVAACAHCMLLDILRNRVPPNNDGVHQQHHTGRVPVRLDSAACGGRRSHAAVVFAEGACDEARLCVSA